MALAAPLTVASPAAAYDCSQEANFKGAPSTSDHAYYCVRAQDSVAFACLMPYGERFYVLDRDKDGYSPVMERKSSSGRYGRVYHDLGHPNWAWRDKDFAETTKTTFRACYIGPANGRYGCGEWRTVGAG